MVDASPNPSRCNRLTALKRRKGTTVAFAADMSISPDGPTGVTTNQKTFGILSYPGAGKSVRIDAASTATEPYTLEMTHRAEGSGASKRNVHVLTMRKKKINAATSQLVEGSVTVSFRVPDDSTITAANYKEMMWSLINGILAGSSNIDRVLRGEV